MRAIACKEVQVVGQPMLVNGQPIMVAEMILRSWATSKNPREQMALLEIAFEKVPRTVSMQEVGRVVFDVVYHRSMG